MSEHLQESDGRESIDMVDQGTFVVFDGFVDCARCGNTVPADDANANTGFCKLCMQELSEDSAALEAPDER